MFLTNWFRRKREKELFHNEFHCSPIVIHDIQLSKPKKWKEKEETPYVKKPRAKSKFHPSSIFINWHLEFFIPCETWRWHPLSDERGWSVHGDIKRIKITIPSTEATLSCQKETKKKKGKIGRKKEEGGKSQVVAKVTETESSEWWRGKSVSPVDLPGARYTPFNLHSPALLNNKSANNNGGGGRY